MPVGSWVEHMRLCLKPIDLKVILHANFLKNPKEWTQNAVCACVPVHRSWPCSKGRQQLKFWLWGFEDYVSEYMASKSSSSFINRNVQSHKRLCEFNLVISFSVKRWHNEISLGKSNSCKTNSITLKNDLNYASFTKLLILLLFIISLFCDWDVWVGYKSVVL